MRAGGKSSLSQSHLPTDCAVSVLIMAELARGRRWSRNLEPNFCPGRGLNPEPHGWQCSTLTTAQPRLADLLVAKGCSLYNIRMSLQLIIYFQVTIAAYRRLRFHTCGPLITEEALFNNTNDRWPTNCSGGESENRLQAPATIPAFRSSVISLV